MLVDIHSHRKSDSRRLIRIENVFIDDEKVPSSCFSIGLHPWHIETSKVSIRELIEYHIPNKNLLAIGEIGLDPNSSSSKEEQIKIFLEHIKISEEHNLPVLLHMVKLFDDIISIKRDVSPKSPWIIHGFNKSSQLAEQLQKEGFYFSFGKDLLKEGSNAQKSFTILDLNRVFLETDDAENLKIEEVYLQAAKLKGLELGDLENKIFNNFKKVFKRYNG